MPLLVPPTYRLDGAVALNIDVSDEDAWIRPHPTSPDHHIVYGVKRRGNTEQIAIGLNKSELSPGNLIRTLVARTEPLRNRLREELVELLKQPDSAKVQKKIEEIRRRLRSPWLFVKMHTRGEIHALNEDYAVEGKGKRRLNSLIEKINKSRHGSDLIPDMTLSDFRDAYISHAYQHSGYSWLVAQLAVGHSSVESLKVYLRKRRWKAHGEGQIRKLGNAMWSEIDRYRPLDPAMLFARVQRGEVTEEQRQRWLAHKDRTRVGTGCRDFFHPPQNIVPDHLPGSGCRVQRCILCDYGIVFEDSVDHLSRRRAELHHLKTELPLVTWVESSFSDELERTELTLERYFDPLLVNRRFEFWTEEIRSGRHIVVHWEGEYGAAA